MQKIIGHIKDAKAKFDEFQSQQGSSSTSYPGNAAPNNAAPPGNAAPKPPAPKSNVHPHHLARPQPGTPIEKVTTPGPVEAVQFLGEVLSTNAELIRDLGFSGRIGSKYINSYGDVLICGSGTRHERENQTKPMILASNCGAFGTEDPCKVVDFGLSGNKARMFVPVLPHEQPGYQYAVGITNVIPMSEREDETRGVVYFLLNWRKGGINRMQGAGVAEVDVSGPTPVAKRIGNSYWWDAKTNPWYGDHSALIAQDGWTYVYGGVNDDKKNKVFYDGMFVCRVPHGSEFELPKYEYWNGKAFVKEMVPPSQESAILGPGSTGGMVTWNPHLKKYLYIYTTFNVIIGRTADRPEGPWGAQFTIKGVADRAFVYCPSQQYRYDPSGKTLVISYTAHPNQIFALRITFK